MIPFAELDAGLVGVVTTILGGGLVYAYVAFKKAGPETEGIAARTLIEVNDDLRKELDRRDRTIDLLEKRLSHMREEIEILEQEVAALRASPRP